MSTLQHPSKTSADLLTDPLALRSAWKDALIKNHHLHGPEAGRLLGVPEAALLASRVGDGATRLNLNLQDIMRSAPDWGKLLFAARNQFGVALGILDQCRYSVSGNAIHLTGANHEVVFGTEQIASCYLFAEHDGHGHTLSLNWFDGGGDVLGRLFLMSKSGRERALPEIAEQALPDRLEPWCEARGEIAAILSLEPRLKIIDGVLTGQAILATAEQAVLSCSGPAAMDIAMAGRGVAMSYRGVFTKAFQTPPAVHATSSECKLHLRFGPLSRIEFGRDERDRPSLVLHDSDEGHLSIKCAGSADSQNRWLQDILKDKQ